MHDLNESSYLLVAQTPHARTWLEKLRLLGCSECTVEVYGRALEDYFQFCTLLDICPETATKEHLLAYLRSLDGHISQPNAASAASIGSRAHRRMHRLSDATLRLWMTALRLYFRFLRCEGIRSDNPLERGTNSLRTWLSIGRGELVRRYRRLPWVPTEELWSAFINEARDESIRNRLVLALAYDTALYPRDLCSLRTSDFHRARRLIWTRLSTPGGHHLRCPLPYSSTTELLYAAYLEVRRGEVPKTGILLLSESDRNRAQPISPDTCRLIVAGIAERAGVPDVTLRTLRHLRLMDLARAGWSADEIAALARLPSPAAAMPYLRLCERELLANGPCSAEVLAESRLSVLAHYLTATPSELFRSLPPRDRSAARRRAGGHAPGSGAI